MKWYKHLVDSGDDPDIQDAMMMFGDCAYYIFFRTLEVMAREFNENNPGVCKFSEEYFFNRFMTTSKRSSSTRWQRFSRNLVRDVVMFYAERGRFIVTFSENKHFKEITINCPKLKDLCDEYTQKLILQKSGVNRELVGSLSGIEEEVRRRNKNITNTGQPKIKEIVSLLSKEKSIPNPSEDQRRSELKQQIPIILKGE